MTASVRFRVYGDATPQGSKTKMPNGAMLEGATAELRAKRINWRNAVAAQAATMLEVPGVERMDGPLSLDVVFRFPMPTSRPAYMRRLARCWKPTAPDLDKLVRSVGDSLTASGLIRDDARIVALRAVKLETTDWHGATITVSTLEHSPSDAGEWLAVGVEECQTLRSTMQPAVFSPVKYPPSVAH